MARYIFIVILVIVTVGPGYLGYYLAYVTLTANEATQTDPRALHEALATATAQADAAVAAVKADLSNEMNTLQAQLVEKSTDLNAALANLGEAGERLKNTLADLSASKALQSQATSKISALEITLAERYTQVEILTASLGGLQSQFDNAQAEIAELTEKLANILSLDSSTDDMGTPTPEPEVVLMNKPELSLEINSRKAMFSSKFRVTVSNTGDAAMTVNAAVSGPESSGLNARELVILGGQELRLGVRDSWVLRSGQTLTLTHANYEPLVYLIP